MTDLNSKSLAETKKNLSKIVTKAKKTGEPTFIYRGQKPEAVLLSIEAYETLVKQGQNFGKHLETYTSEQLDINLPDVEWTENDGWG